MAARKTTLEYISSSTGLWTKALTSDGNDAVVMLNVEQNISAPAKADVILSNRSVDPASSNPTTAKGILADVFFEFQRIRLVHQAIGIPIFSGLIYRVRDVDDAQYGQTIRLTAFDTLKELQEFPIEDADDDLESVNTTSSNLGGYDVRKRSQVIKYMLDKVNLKDKNLLTTDTDQFEDSWSTASLGDSSLNLTKLDRHVAGVMFELAMADPIQNASASAVGESGYDYRVEPRFLSSATNHTPIDSLHYFMRGTRPGRGGAYGNTATPTLITTSTDSLKIEYTNSDSADDSGLKQTMMPQYEFDKPKEELYTSVVCHYTDGGTEDASAYGESHGSNEGVVTFELLKGSAMTGTFTWTGKALDIGKPGVINVPEYLDYGQVEGVAVVQWQNSTSDYLLISHINEATFPTTNGNVVLTGADSGATFTFNPTTDRMKTKYGVERPTRIQRPMTSDLDMIREEVVARLVGRTDLEIIRSKFSTVQYPIVYHDLPSNSSRSSNTITWSGTVAARTRGVRKGNIVAEIDASGQYVRYAYISVVTNDESITYGASATDTSDGTALDASNTIRLVIPLRPGDVIRVVRAASDINTDQVILSLGYDETPGMFAAKYETIGSNNKFNNLFSEGGQLNTTLANLAPKKFPPRVSGGSAQDKGQLSFFFDGFVNRASNPSDANNYRKIHWTNAANATSGTAGTLIFSDGTKYAIACANSATLTTAEHTIFFRNTKSKATRNKSDTAFQVILSTSYVKDSADILVGWCKASDNKAGAKAVLVLAPQFSSNDLFASGQNASLTEALFSKSAQEYSSGLEIKPLTSGSNKHLQVTWAACTATSGPGSTSEQLTFGDGDVWSIAAKDGSNYSATDNGTSFANITALAASSTYFVFIDTADTAAGGTLTLRFTTKYEHIAKSSDGATFFSTRVLMAQIAVPANGDDGAAPRIFPFNNRSLTINAASIAADSITATHVTATAIDTTHLKLTGDNSIGGITSAGLLNLSFTSGSLSLDNTTNGSNKIAITSAQQTDFAAGGDEAGATTAAAAAAAAASAAATHAALGLDATGNIKKNVVVDGTSNSPTFYSWNGGQTFDGNLVLVNASGIAGYTGVSGTYSEGSTSTDGFTLPSDAQFEIRTTDGRGYFGAGAGILGSTGLEISQVSGNNAGNAMVKFTSSTGSTQMVKYNADDGGYPASTMIMGRSDTPAGWIFQTSGQKVGAGATDPAGFIYAGTRTAYTTLGRNTTGGAFAALMLRCNDINGTFAYEGSSTPLNTYGYLFSKSDGTLYWKRTISASTTEIALTGGVSLSDNPVWTGIHKFDAVGSSAGILLKVGTQTSDPPTGYARLNAWRLSAGTVRLTLVDEDSNMSIITDTDHSGGGGGGGGGGDITGVTAGDGLTGGGTGGTVTLTMGTPSDSSPLTSNAVTSTGHTHAITGTSGGGSYTHPDPITLGNGSAGAPTFSFSGDPDTGMYRASNTLVWSIDSDNTMQLATTTLSALTANLFVKDGSNGLPVRDGTDGEVEVQYGSSGFFYKVSSSERWKMNIRDLDVDSSAVYSLVPKSFEGKKKVYDENEASGWRETGEAGGTQFGLIAEEVAQVLPALVTYDEDEIPNNVDYKLISVLLVEEMKKLKDRIEVLEGD